jgi:tRNA pseudouridine38-40 synthase
MSVRTSVADIEEAPKPRTMAAIVAYDGALFHGFARQPGLRTVQGALEDALAVSLRREVQTTGAGRTDAGVHAWGQVVSFDAADGDETPERLRRSLDALSGDGIVVRDVREARPGFSARFDAVGREYHYRIVNGTVPPLFLDRVAWHVAAELDVEAMREGASMLVGERDFRSFCVTESALGKSTIRRLDTVEITRQVELGESVLLVRVEGNAFLHSMVRTIVGSLVEVGSGRREPQWIAEAVEACDRAAAGPTAPAHGLTLFSVRYPPGTWTHSADA